MSSPLLHSPAEIVRQLLVDLGLGTSAAEPLGDWPAYDDGEPDGPGVPDEVLTVYDDVAQDDGHGQVDGYNYTHHGLQVRVRGRDHPAANRKAYSVWRTLNEGVHNATVTVDGTAYTVHAVRASAPRRVGRDLATSRRHLFTVNGVAAVSVNPVAAPDPHDIVSVTDDAGVALVTTAGPHGLTAESSQIVVVGTTGGLYDGTYSPIGAVLSPTTFYPGVAYAGDSTGGTWSLA